MSEQEQAQEQDVKNKIVISPEDALAALDFWRHFNIPINPELEQAIEAFSKAQTIENQDKIKLEICRAISTTDHEAFKDEMFEKIVAECRGVTFDMQFDRDLEQTLTVNKE